MPAASACIRAASAAACAVRTSSFVAQPASITAPRTAGNNAIRNPFCILHSLCRSTHARGEANTGSAQKFAILLGCHSIYTDRPKRRDYRYGTKRDYRHGTKIESNAFEQSHGVYSTVRDSTQKCHAPDSRELPQCCR